MGREAKCFGTYGSQSGDGKAAQETDPDGTASREIAALYDWVMAQLKQIKEGT